MIRRLLSGILAAIAGLLFVGLIYLRSGYAPMVERDVRVDKAIDAAFKQSVVFLDGYRNRHSTYPSKEDFDAWVAANIPLSYESGFRRLIIYDAARANRFSGTLDRFGNAPADSYVLIANLDSGPRYYASWTGHSTVKTDPKSYYLLGVLTPEDTVLGPLVLGAALLAWLAWPRRRADSTSNTAATK